MTLKAKLEAIAPADLAAFIAAALCIGRDNAEERATYPASLTPGEVRLIARALRVDADWLADDSRGLPAVSAKVPTAADRARAFGWPDNGGRHASR